MAHKPSFFDRIIGIFRAKPAEQVAREREQKKHRRERQSSPKPPTPKPTSTPKPAPLPRDFDDFIPPEDVTRFNAQTATLQELEWEIMNHSEPLEVRRAAAERWAAIAPRPLQPQLPFIEGVGHENFWMAFRDAYHETEIF